jgi:hypothetical protein
MMFSLPEGCKVVQAVYPQVCNAGAVLQGNYISMKGAQMVWVVFHLCTGHGTAIPTSIEVASAIAGTGHTAITNLVPIWVNASCATNDTLVRETTDAVNFTTAATITKQIIVIYQIDPSQVTGLTGGDCLSAVVGISNAANIASCMYYVLPRYPGPASSAPSVILD